MTVERKIKRFREGREKAHIKDEVTVIVRDKDGNIKSQHTLNSRLLHRLLVRMGLAHNSITNGGFADAAALLGNVAGAPAAFQYLGIGTGTTGDVAADTQLQTPTKLKLATTITRITTTQTNDTLELIATFSNALDSITGTSAINEVGVFNGTVNGTARILLHIAGSSHYGAVDSCNWDQGDSFQLTVKVKCEQGA